MGIREKCQPVGSLVDIRPVNLIWQLWMDDLVNAHKKGKDHSADCEGYPQFPRS